MEAATIIPSTDSGISADAHVPSPCRRASACIWPYETTAAITARRMTLAVVTA